MRHLVFASFCLAFLVPAAAAHITNPHPSEVVELGDYKLAVTPVPSPVYQNTSTSLVLVNVEHNDSREFPTLRVRFSDEQGFLFERNVSRNGSFYETGRVSFNTTGEIQARIIMDEGETEGDATVKFNVYRPLPFSFAPIDATSDPVEKRTFTLTFKTLDPNTSIPIDALRDLRAIVVPKGGVTPPNAADAFHQFSQNGTGTWSTNVTFTASGTWWILLASGSGGFEGHETPPWQVDVLAAPDTKDTSATGLTTVIAAFLVAAALVMRAPPRRAR